MHDNAASFAAFVALIEQITSVPINPVTLTRDTRLANDLALDSISLISLMALSEERFGISLAEHTARIANLRTVGDAVDLVDSLAVVRA
jgi:acyl carrier protein